MLVRGHRIRFARTGTVLHRLPLPGLPACFGKRRRTRAWRRPVIVRLHRSHQTGANEGWKRASCGAEHLHGMRQPAIRDAGIGARSGDHLCRNARRPVALRSSRRHLRRAAADVGETGIGARGASGIPKRLAGVSPPNATVRFQSKAAKAAKAAIRHGQHLGAHGVHGVCLWQSALPWQSNRAEAASQR
jgi:hypothetical protein